MRIAGTIELLMWSLATVLQAQLPQPTPVEQKRAEQIAALPADGASAAVAGIEKARITPGLVEAFLQVSESCHNLADRERLARLAIAAARRGSLVEMEGQGDFVLAQALLAQSSYYDATESYSDAIEKYQEAGSPAHRLCGAFANRSIARVHLGDLNGALEDSQRALSLNHQTRDEVQTARILNGLGNIYRELGDFHRALEAFEKSLKIAEEKNQKLGEAFLLNNIGSVYVYQGDYRQAIEYQLRSLKIKESLGKTSQAISSLVNLSESYEHAGMYSPARHSADRALTLARETGQRTELALALKMSARVDLGGGRYTRGLAQLAEARSIFKQTGEQLDEADVLMDIARARLAQGHYSDAVKAALESRDLARQTSGPVVLADATLFLGQAYRALGKVAEARAALAESIAAVEELRDNVAGAESERESFLAGHTDAYRELLALDMEQGQTAPAFRLAEQAKGRALLDLLRGGRPELDRRESLAERRQEVTLRGRLASLRAQRAAASASDAASLQELDRRIQAARLKLADFRSALYFAHPELRMARGDVLPVSLAQAGELLGGPHSALLEYVVMPRRTYLFVIVRGKSGPELRTHVLRLKQQTLGRAVAHFREQIASRDPGFAEAGRKLYAWLLQPAARDLAAKTALVIVPDGELWRLPFQALQDASGRFLAQDAAISYAPSLSVMHALLAEPTAGARGPRTLMVLADPSGNTPEADREARSIADLYGGSNTHVWRGAAATSDVFRAQAGDFDVLHLAAHGVFDDRHPMLSHVILAPPPRGSDEDGWVEAGEVRSMQLKAALVVLSGCETARGHFENGEGAVGLSWAFLAAGARAAVASQWRVESESTSTLMVAFYKSLLAGASGAEALRRASLKLLATGQFHHPFYWAGFVLLGLPEEMLPTRRQAASRDWRASPTPVPSAPASERRIAQRQPRAGNDRRDIAAPDPRGAPPRAAPVR